jgi:GxxExxY protein
MRSSGWASKSRGAEEFTMKSMELMKGVENDLVSKVIGCAIEVHRHLGPGLLESAYESCLCLELTIQGIPFVSQAPLDLDYKGKRVDCAYRMDLVVDRALLLELKCVESLQPIHQAQIISYLKLSGLKQGLLINFNARVLKDGIKSFLN